MKSYEDFPYPVYLGYLYTSLNSYGQPHMKVLKETYRNVLLMFQLRSKRCLLCFHRLMLTEETFGRTQE